MSTASLPSRSFLGAVTLSLAVAACSSTPDDTSAANNSGGTSSAAGGAGGVAATGAASGSGGEGEAAGDCGMAPRPPIDGPLPPLDAEGFYDIDANADPRPIRSDLVGELKAMVQFGQSHTVNPAGNDANHHPTLVAERAALVLITPQDQDVASLELEWRVNGGAVNAEKMRHPNDIPRADSINADGRAEVVYSKRAWTLVLPWDHVVPGLELVVRDGQGREGILAADAIEFAAPAELVLKVMRLGMLAEPPGSDDHWMVLEPVRAASDYFETLPIAELVLGSYDPVRLERVMVRDGTVYETASTTEGGVYDGDMRQDCAKSSYSAGVNLADQGIPSSAMSDESNPRTTAQVVIHHAQGLYANGVQVHGLSGGAGIGTLLSSTGNELTHELGHNWGLGHYPGEQDGNYYWAAHHHESGWGFVQRRYRMRANLAWTEDGSQTVTNGVASNVTWKNGTYSFNNDPMSGATVSSSISQVSHHTGYTARLTQQFLDRGMIRASSTTGYAKWNQAEGQLEELTPSAGVRKPSRIGVPVYTFWGGYDPNAAAPKAVLYPALRGNYGHVFELPVPASTGDACWVEVTFADGAKREIAVAVSRHTASSVNKLHFNIAQEDAPQAAKLLCRWSDETSELDSITIAAAADAQPAAVRVGRDSGFIAYQQVEFESLEETLGGLPEEPPMLRPEQWDLLDQGYEQIGCLLSEQAAEKATQLVHLFDAVGRLDSWMTQHASALDDDDADVIAQLSEKVHDLGLGAGDALMPAGHPIASGDQCMTAEADRALSVTACNGSASQRFIYDARGALHPAEHLEWCITGGANAAPVGLADCDRIKESQSWRQDGESIRSSHAPHLALDNASGNVISYNYHGGNNQKWSALTPTNSILLAVLSSYNLERLSRLVD